MARWVDGKKAALGGPAYSRYQGAYAHCSPADIMWAQQLVGSLVQ